MKKIIFLVLGCVLLTVVCLIITGVGLGFRYVSSGVNPFRELKMATVGESIEIKDTPAPHGRTRRQLLIDSIDHGTQYQGNNKPGFVQNDKTAWSRQPTTYYHPNGPVGLAMNRINWFSSEDIHAGDARLPASVIAIGATSPLDMLASAWSEPPIGVVMMNNGTPAAYAHPFQCVDFFESNPKIVGLSRGKEKQFTYIEEAQRRGAHVRVFEGNERRSVEKNGPTKFYHILVVDTSRGHPGVPSKELLTTEAMQAYFNALADDGILCVHTSSRDFRLEEIVAATAHSQGLANLHIHDGIFDSDTGHYTSDWILIARRPQALEPVRELADRHNERAIRRMPHEKIDVRQIPISSANVWTDSGSNSLSSVRR
jgi:hypothetical protein